MHTLRDFSVSNLFFFGKKKGFLLVIYLLNFNFRTLQVTYVEPGQSSEIEGRNGSKLRVKATAGPVLGPPWQRPENG